MVVRYLPDGSVDPSFNGGAPFIRDVHGLNDDARAVVVQPDGRILIGGSTVVPGSPETLLSRIRFLIARLHPNGTLDDDFGVGGMVVTQQNHNAAGIWDMALMDDGRIVAAGAGRSGSDEVWPVVRLMPDGSFDQSFSYDGVVNVVFPTSGFAQGLALQPDGKVLLAGGTGVGVALVRLNVDGTLDGTFGTLGKVQAALVAGSCGASDVALRPDGRIVVAGYAVVGGATDHLIAQFMPDGQQDMGFGTGGVVVRDAGTTWVDIAEAIALQADGRIIVAGYAEATLGGYPIVSWLARYTATGTVDASFAANGIAQPIGSSSESAFRSIALQQDHKVLVAGRVTIGSDADLLLARYLNDTDIGLEEFAPAPDFRLFPNPATEQAYLTYTLNTSEALTCALLDMQGRVVRTFFTASRRPAGEQRETLDLHGLAAGTYMLAMRSESHSLTTRIVKLQHP